MENLFDVINNKMFSVFERKDRRTNYDLLATIYDIFVSDERQQAIPKEDLIDKVTSYIKGRPFEEFDDEDDFDDFDDELDEDDFEDEGFDFGDEETTIYEVTCACGNVIAFDEETLEEGSIICDVCGETLEFSLDDDDAEIED